MGVDINMTTAGPWRQRLLNANFTSIRHHNRINSKIFRDIQLMQPLHEPFLRDNRTMTGEMLTSFLNAKAANAESRLMTVMGEKMEIAEECDHCQENRGPWAICAVVRGSKHSMALRVSSSKIATPSRLRLKDKGRNWWIY